MATESSSGAQPSQSATPPAAPAASSSTVPDINSAAKAASSVADVRKLAEQLRSNPRLQLAKAPSEKPVQPPAEATPPAEPAPAEPDSETPAVTEQPAEETPAAPAEGETPAEATPEAQDMEPEEDDGGDGPIKPIQAKRARVRLSETDEVGRLALAYQSRNKDWSLEQAIEAAKKQLGVAEKPAEKPADDGKPKLPQSVQEVESLMSQKQAEYKKALANVDFEKAADLNAEMLQLTQHRFNLELSVERQQQQEAAKYDADFAASEKKAVEMYPFAADQASPAAKRMKEIDAALQANEDPLYYAANKPLKIAQMVAAEMNIAPKSKTAAPAKTAAVPATPAPKKGVLPGGGSSTTPPPVNQKPAIIAKIQETPNTVGGLRALRKELGLPY